MNNTTIIQSNKNRANAVSSNKGTPCEQMASIISAYPDAAVQKPWITYLEPEAKLAPWKSELISRFPRAYAVGGRSPNLHACAALAREMATREAFSSLLREEPTDLYLIYSSGRERKMLHHLLNNVPTSTLRITDYRPIHTPLDAVVRATSSTFPEFPPARVPNAVFFMLDIYKLTVNGVSVDFTIDNLEALLAEVAPGVTFSYGIVCNKLFDGRAGGNEGFWFRNNENEIVDRADSGNCNYAPHPACDWLFRQGSYSQFNWATIASFCEQGTFDPVLSPNRGPQRIMTVFRRRHADMADTPPDYSPLGCRIDQTPTLDDGLAADLVREVFRRDLSTQHPIMVDLRWHQMILGMIGAKAGNAYSYQTLFAAMDEKLKKIIPSHALSMNWTDLVREQVGYSWYTHFTARDPLSSAYVLSRGGVLTRKEEASANFSPRNPWWYKHADKLFSLVRHSAAFLLRAAAAFVAYKAIRSALASIFRFTPANFDVVEALKALLTAFCIIAKELSIDLGKYIMEHIRAQPYFAPANFDLLGKIAHFAAYVASIAGETTIDKYTFGIVMTAIEFPSAGLSTLIPHILFSLLAKHKGFYTSFVAHLAFNYRVDNNIMAFLALLGACFTLAFDTLTLEVPLALVLVGAFIHPIVTPRKWWYIADHPSVVALRESTNPPRPNTVPLNIYTVPTDSKLEPRAEDPSTDKELTVSADLAFQYHLEDLHLIRHRSFVTAPIPPCDPLFSVIRKGAPFIENDPAQRLPFLFLCPAFGSLKWRAPIRTPYATSHALRTRVARLPLMHPAEQYKVWAAEVIPRYVFMIAEQLRLEWDPEKRWEYFIGAMTTKKRTLYVNQRKNMDLDHTGPFPDKILTMVKADEMLLKEKDDFKGRLIQIVPLEYQVYIGPYIAEASYLLKTSFGAHQVRDPFVLHGDRIVRFFYGPGMGSDELSFIRQRFDEDMADIYFICAGDDNVAWIRQRGKEFALVSDFSQYDQSQSSGPLKFEMHLLHALGVPLHVVDRLEHTFSLPYFIADGMGAKKTGSELWNHPKRPLRATGGPDTTFGNTIVNAACWMHIFDTQPDLEDIFALHAGISHLGFTAKLQTCPIEDSDFLKGVWYETDLGSVWGPLPSRLFKCKVWDVPEPGNWDKIRKAIREQWASYSPFSWCPCYRSLDTSHEINPFRVDWDPFSNGCSLRPTLVNVDVLLRRYGISYEDLESVEGAIRSWDIAIAPPKEVLLRIIAADYAAIVGDVYE